MQGALFLRGGTYTSYVSTANKKKLPSSNVKDTA